MSVHNIRTKVIVIKRNAHKYPVSVLCKILGISRSSYYYEPKAPKDESVVTKAIQAAYEENRCLYGSRKIKRVLAVKGIVVSRRKICRIMKQLGLESAYTRKKYKKHSKEINQAITPNILDRQFDNQEHLATIVSDITYVRVGQRWGYVCILLDLHNREIIGYSSGNHRDAKLVHRAFSSAKVNLSKIQLFHTDRGSEFDNTLIDELLDTFNIQRSLSLKGCPYDNAVAEATFKLIKSEFINRRIFETQEQLALELADYVNWFNNIRLHGSLGYVSPVEYREGKDENKTLSFLCE